MSTPTATLSAPAIAVPADAPAPKRWTFSALLFTLLGVAAIVSTLVWMALTSGGSPDPTVEGLGHGAALFNIALLVFREGMECVLVLSAILASMVGKEAVHRRPVWAGVGVGVLATIATWFVAVGIVTDLTESHPALDMQVWTGLLAIVVLLVIMNWFFHKIYWGGWITAHNRRKRELIAEKNAGGDDAGIRRKLLLGLGILGFSSLYREGFEIVLFLQSYHLKMGGGVVLGGCVIGLVLTGILAALTFVAHRHLPYRQMLVLTGILLAGVLMIMVGEQVFEMQQADMIATTEIPALKAVVPDWAGVWFSLFPNWQSCLAQLAAAVLVGGSYIAARLKARHDQTA
ncbi:MAG TPA: FTR1 family protein [Candidatus Methylacidiphilales bacterium]